MHRLYVRIYLAVLGSLLVFALLAGLGWKLFGPRIDDDRPDVEAVLIEGLANDLFPADESPERWLPTMRRWAQRLDVQLSVHDAGGRVLVATDAAAEPLPAWMREAAGDGDIWHGFDRRRQRLALPLPADRFLSVTDADGRWVGRWRGGGLAPVLGVLALIGVAVAIAAWPLARRLTRRLERLEASVRRFGGGDLSARARVRGRDEIAALAGSFNRAAEQIEGLIRAQKSLLANASHELRSPLARIRMAAALLGGPVSADRAESLNAELRRSVEELDALVDEILLASRLDAEEGGLAPNDPPETLDLGGLVAEEAARQGLAAQVVSLEISGQSRLLRRLVRNLIENAQRYGRDGDGRADIEVVVAPRPGGGAVLTVCDRGPGVPEDERERIFEPFYRARGRSEREGGVGLGLALVRRIARRHGGEARCRAREGGGSCFEVSIAGAARGPAARA